MAGMDAKAARRRWFWPTPAWLVWGAAAATGVLFACERWRWFPVNYQKGFPVLLAVAVVAAVLMLILAWMLVALVFRRRMQFGLRTMLVFVTLCAVVCSWLTVRIKQARRQAEEIAAIKEKHGSASYHWETASIERMAELVPAPPGPERLRKLLGIDFFGIVEHLYVPTPPTTDAELEHLTVLRRLKRLGLCGDNVSDAHLSHLGGLSTLRRLWLVDTKVTEEGVKKLHDVLPNCAIYVVQGGQRIFSAGPSAVPPPDDP